MKPLPALIVTALVAGSWPAVAHDNASSGHKPTAVRKEQKDWGIAGVAKPGIRTIEITMTDNMRFSPDRIEVREGETVRLVHRNAGKVLHEFVLGTKKELDEHAALMAKFPTMEHDEPYMSHVAAGKRGQIVWTFNRPGEFDFACLIPGHYTAGMVGKIIVIAKGTKS